MRKIVTLTLVVFVFGQPLARAAERSPAAPATESSGTTKAPADKPCLRQSIDRPAILASGWLTRDRSRLPREEARDSSWIRRHPVLTGTLIGAAGGAVAAGTMENELFCSGGDEDCLIYGGGRILVGAGIGAGVGALVGVLIGAGRK